MPVGTAATVKGLTQEALEQLGASIILANTYHLYLRPGHELIRKLGGLHSFMSWRGAILTDSGGYQVFSLADLRKISDEGVRFRSHLDGSEHLLTPEKAAEIQLALGSDIAMVLDECIETPAPRNVAEAALKRTTDWARRARNCFLEAANRNGNPAQWQFGIVQGATYADLRRESARQLLELDFPGYAVGGLAVGEPHEVTCEMAAEVTALLPAHERRPRADQKHALYRRPAPDRSAMLLQRLPPLHTSVSSASFRRRRDHRLHPGNTPQCPLLP